MLEHTYQLLTKQKLAIPSKFDRLILSLKTAYANEWNLDKNVSVHNDDLDALRLLLKGSNLLMTNNKIGQGTQTFLITLNDQFWLSPMH